MSEMDATISEKNDCAEQSTGFSKTGTCVSRSRENVDDFVKRFRYEQALRVTAENIGTCGATTKSKAKTDLLRACHKEQMLSCLPS